MAAHVQAVRPMSVLQEQANMLRALGSAFHTVAEERMPREGKVTDVIFPDECAARTLGSMAQGFERAAEQLEEQHAQLERLIQGASPQGR